MSEERMTSEQVRKLTGFPKSTGPDRVSVTLEALERLNLIERAVANAPDGEEKDRALIELKEFRAEFQEERKSRQDDRKKDNDTGDRRHGVSVRLAVAGIILAVVLSAVTTWVGLALAS